MGAYRRRVVLVVGLGAFAAALTVPWSQARAAAPNQLSSPAVAPASGDTTTTFQFAVQYLGRYPATSVTCVVGARTVVLALTSGSATDGTYMGSSRLPAGTWSVTFNAAAAKGNAPTISGPSVTVAGPTASPRPSVAPVAAATPVTTPKPAAPAPAATVTPKATAVPVAVASSSPTPAAAAVARSTDEADPGGGEMAPVPTQGDFAPQAFWPVMLAGLGVIGLFIAYYVFAMDRDRRRRAQAVEMALAAQRSSLVTELSGEPERAPAVWELDARLEDAPIGTVEYLPLENGTAIGSLPEDLTGPERTRRGNPRLARMTDARQHRFSDDRRSLLRRG